MILLVWGKRKKKKLSIFIFCFLSSLHQIVITATGKTNSKSNPKDTTIKKKKTLPLTNVVGKSDHGLRRHEFSLTQFKLQLSCLLHAQLENIAAFHFLGFQALQFLFGRMRDGDE